MLYRSANTVSVRPYHLLGEDVITMDIAPGDSLARWLEDTDLSPAHWAGAGKSDADFLAKICPVLNGVQEGFSMWVDYAFALHTAKHSSGTYSKLTDVQKTALSNKSELRREFAAGKEEARDQLRKMAHPQVEGHNTSTGREPSEKEVLHRAVVSMTQEVQDACDKYDKDMDFKRAKLLQTLSNEGISFFHGDPHSGNMIWNVNEAQPQGKFIFLDFGNSHILTGLFSQYVELTYGILLGDVNSVLKVFPVNETSKSAAEVKHIKAQVIQALQEHFAAWRTPSSFRVLYPTNVVRSLWSTCSWATSAVCRSVSAVRD